jgi:hypothetical protein
MKEMMHACTSIHSHKPRNNLSGSEIYGGIHVFSHIRQLVDLQLYVVRVPVVDFILAQQFPNKAHKESSKLNTLHTYIPRCIYFRIIATRQIYPQLSTFINI